MTTLKDRILDTIKEQGRVSEMFLLDLTGNDGSDIPDNLIRCAIRQLLNDSEIEEEEVWTLTATAPRVYQSKKIYRMPELLP
jgi:hypothetical protein